MSSIVNTHIVPVHFQYFDKFTSLPPEVRILIWQLSLPSRIVEILWSVKGTGFYANATLPIALQVCRESRCAVESQYPRWFGSFLLQERIRFNLALDILYFDIAQSEHGIPYFLAIAKEIELKQLRYIAIDEGYFSGGMTEEPGLNRAVAAMTNVRELMVVLDVSIGEDPAPSETQMELYDGAQSNENERLRLLLQRLAMITALFPMLHKGIEVDKGRV